MHERKIFLVASQRANVSSRKLQSASSLTVYICLGPVLTLDQEMRISVQLFHTLHAANRKSPKEKTRERYAEIPQLS